MKKTKDPEVIIKETRQMIIATVKKFLIDKSKVEDVAQDILMRTEKLLLTHAQEPTYHRWIFTISKNAAIDYNRKLFTENKYLPKIPLSEYETQQRVDFDDDLAEKIFGSEEIICFIRNELSKLKGDLAETLILRYYYMEDVHTIAARYHVKENVVYYRLNKAKALLKIKANEFTKNH